MGLQETVVSEGHATTADDGTFDVEMPMVLPEDLGGHAMFYHFVAEAEVTDVAGETHSGTVSLPLGNKPSALTCDLPQQVRRDQLPQVTFRRYNAAGRDIEGTVSYRVDDGKWQQGAANTRLSVLSAQLKSGEHRLQAVCDQDTLDMTFVVFGLDDKKPASPTHDWFYVSHQEFPADGQPVTLQVGASDPNLYIVYSIFANDKQLESGVVTKNAALLNRQFTYKKEYADGLLLTYADVCMGEERPVPHPSGIHPPAHARQETHPGLGDLPRQAHAGSAGGVAADGEERRRLTGHGQSDGCALRQESGRHHATSLVV